MAVTPGMTCTRHQKRVHLAGSRFIHNYSGTVCDSQQFLVTYQIPRDEAADALAGLAAAELLLSWPAAGRALACGDARPGNVRGTGHRGLCRRRPRYLPRVAGLAAARRAASPLSLAGQRAAGCDYGALAAWHTGHIGSRRVRST